MYIRKALMDVNDVGKCFQVRIMVEVASMGIAPRLEAALTFSAQIIYSSLCVIRHRTFFSLIRR